MKRKYLAGRILAFALVFVLTFTAVPVYSFAEGSIAEETGNEGSDYDAETEIGEIEDSEEGNGQEGVQPEIEEDSEKESFTEETPSENGEEQKEDGEDGAEENETSEASEEEDDSEAEEVDSEPAETQEETGEEFIEEEVNAGEVLGESSKEIRLNEENFPDEIFRNYIETEFAEFIDNDGKGKFFREDSFDTVKIINVNKLGISNLKGIEYFRNLATLNATDNNLVDIDLSHNEKLERIDFFNNSLKEIDVSKNTLLESIQVTENQIEKLDVSKNAKLMFLYCSANQLESLDVSANKELWEVDCNNNKLTELKTGTSETLMRVACSNNKLTTIDVSNNAGLLSFGCSGNLLTALDVSKNLRLEALGCSSNRLKKLDVSKNTVLESLSCGDNRLTVLDLRANKILDTLECYGNDIQYMDLSKNPKLKKLYCSNNQLAYLDLTGNTELEDFDCKNNKFPITVDKNGDFNLKEIKGFNKNKAKNYQNATLEDDTLTLDRFIMVSEVKYKYVCGNNNEFEADFAFKVNYSQIELILDGNEGKINGQDAKKITVTCGKNYTGLVTPSRKDYNFDGWYTKKEGGRRVSSADEVTVKDFAESGERKLYAHWSDIRKGLVVRLVKPESVVYTGSALKPEVNVWAVDAAGSDLLTEGVDYTIKYSNNVAANRKDGENWWNDKKKPTVTITAKGNYSGTAVDYFEIMPYEFTEEDAGNVAPIFLNESKSKVKKPQKASPVVKWKGKTLKNNTDYVLDYGEGDYIAPKEYKITVKGKEKSNFTGEFTVTETITANVLMSKVKVPSIANYTYKDLNGDGKCDTINPENLNLKLTYGSKKLELNKHYTVVITDYEQVGTATIKFIAKENSGYEGSITKTFKIVGLKLSASNVSFSDNKSKMIYDPTYDPDPEKLSGECPRVNVTYGKEKKALTRGIDYIVEYPETIKKGSMKIKVTGIGSYYGTVSKSFTVSVHKTSKDDSKIVIGKLPVIPYTKGGAQFNPEQLDVKYVADGKSSKLVYGTDYTVSYSNNNAVNRKEEGAWDDDSKIPTVKFNFKGNYSGSRTAEFEIAKKDLSSESCKITAKDIIFNTGDGKYKTKVTLTDENGKELNEGIDYDLAYYRGACTLGETEKLKPMGSKDYLKGYDDGDRDKYVTVVAIGKNLYFGKKFTVYNVKLGLLDDTSISLAPGVKKFYAGDGRGVELASDELVVKAGTKRLVENVDYYIDRTSYKDNDKVGTATVTIKGMGEYGGSKTIKYTISKRTVILLPWK